MRINYAFSRIKSLKEEVTYLGRDPFTYKYDLNTQNAYRIEHTRFGSFAYILINDGKHGKEAKVDLSDFYEYRLYSYRWLRSSSDPKKDYPHANTYNSAGKKINLLLHILIMGSKKDRVIDHNDGDHYNASRSNLNHVTIMQNNQNRHIVSKAHRYDKKAAATTKYVPLFTY